jgi:ABC-type nitrate/sulfonate/bicarbonate transport system ATPase subunit
MTSAGIPKLRIESISKSFYKTVRDEVIVVPVLAGIDFAVERGRFVSIIGPSGCGKSTLLRIIDGLIRPDSGRVLVDGVEVSEPGFDRAVVFQYFGLYPWRNVLDNVAFGLELQNVSMAEREERALANIRLVGLQGFERHYPHELSGGMRQRVGLARALTLDPDIILMDEPFSAVDEQTREILQHELLELWSKTAKTIVFVTHSIDEAVYMSDQVIVMGPRPSGIAAVIDVELPRPRDDSTRARPEFGRIRTDTWEILKAGIRQALPEMAP